MEILNLFADFQLARTEKVKRNRDGFIRKFLGTDVVAIKCKQQITNAYILCNQETLRKGWEL